MLLKDLYIILEKQNNNNLIEAIIELNEDHEIFKAHFPSNPLLPGVCGFQIAKEISENILQKKFLMYKAQEIKFLKMIVPTENKILKFQVQYKFSGENFVAINVKISDQSGTICTKMKATFKLKN